MSLTDRLQHAWDAFMNRDPTYYRRDLGMSSALRPDRPRLTRGNERSIITAVFNRIALDCSSIDFCHARLDENKRFIGEIASGLNNCLTLEANLDQTARAFILDVVLSMLDEGEVAIVPVDTSVNPVINGSYDILTLRTGKIRQWYPEHVKVELYNQKSGRREEVILPKKVVGIIENPLYAVINEPNSTAQRLAHKLALLDITDDQTASGKLNLILQLPYTIKTDARRKQADARRNEIEAQLVGSKYGIAYADGTERITQLNRPLDNQLLTQVESLTDTLYSQLGITKEIMDGTANEMTMLNYFDRTIEPIANAIADELKRKFLTKTARTQGQSIVFFRDPFKLVPVIDIANIADTFTRNEIMSSNEVRQIIGMKPADDPGANELRNKNISQPMEEEIPAEDEFEEPVEGEEALAEPTEDNSEEENPFEGMTKEEMLEEYKRQIAQLDDFDSQLDDLEKQLG